MNRKTCFLFMEASCWLGGLLLCGLFLAQVFQAEVRRIEDLERVDFDEESDAEVPGAAFWDAAGSYAEGVVEDEVCKLIIGKDSLPLDGEKLVERLAQG